MGRTISRPAFVRLLALSAVFLGAREARAEEYPTVAYELVEGSTYQDGCFEPCECPLLQEQPMDGSFDLVFYPYAGPMWTVGVERIAFRVPSLGKQITGQGTYRRAGTLHELRLDLQIDGGPPRAFDSGWVADGDAYPFIDVIVSMNGLFCYDIALHLRAAPAVPTIDLAVDDAQLVWSAMPGVSAYDVLSGDLTALRASGGDFTQSVDACLADAMPGTSLAQAVDVAPGQTVWFLVRPDGGSYDSGGATQAGSRDASIAAASLACP